MEDIQGAANVRRQEIRTQGRAYEKLIDNSLSSLIQKEGFSTSKVLQQNEQTEIVLEIVLENGFHHIRFNSLAKNVTGNRVFRRKKSIQQREVNIDTGKETDSNKTV